MSTLSHTLAESERGRDIHPFRANGLLCSQCTKRNVQASGHRKARYSQVSLPSAAWLPDIYYNESDKRVLTGENFEADFGSNGSKITWPGHANQEGEIICAVTVVTIRRAPQAAESVRRRMLTVSEDSDTEF